MMNDYYQSGQERSLLRLANVAFELQDYDHAMFLYKHVAANVGSNYFDANISVCKKRIDLIRSKKILEVNCYFDEKDFSCDSISLNDIKQLYLTMRCSLDIKMSLRCSPKNIVLVITEGVSVAEDTNRSGVLKDLINAWATKHWGVCSVDLQSESFVFVSQNCCDEAYCEKQKDLPFLIDTKEISIDNIAQNLNHNIYACRELFHRIAPRAIVLDCGLTLAVPAIVAAKQLGITIIKNQGEYASQYEFEKFNKKIINIDFSQRYILDSIIADICPVIYTRGMSGIRERELLMEIFRQAFDSAERIQSSVNLKKGESYTLEKSIESSEPMYYLQLRVSDLKDGNKRGLVAYFEFYNNRNEVYSDRVTGFSSSERYKNYKYISTSEDPERPHVLIFNVPENTSHIRIKLISFFTSTQINITDISVESVQLGDIGIWVHLKALGVEWARMVDSFLLLQGALSLRLALLNYIFNSTKHHNDKKRLNGAIQEMVELDRTWIPHLVSRMDEPLSSMRVANKGNKNKLTVIHLHKTAYPYENTGGAIRSLNTVLSQQNIGIDSYIITPLGYPRSAGIKDSKLHEVICGIDQFRMGPISNRVSSLSFVEQNKLSVFIMAKLISKRGGSIIHAASGVRGYELVQQALALKDLLNLPVLYEVRSFHEHTWRSLTGDIMSLEKTRLRMLKEDECIRRATMVTTISDAMRSELISRGHSSEKIRVVPNAIDKDKFQNAINGSAIYIPDLISADLVVGYISNMSRREGHEYLIRAIHKLRIDTQRDIRGLFVGNGPEYSNLIRLVHELGLKKQIVFTGEVDHSEIERYYKAMDIFVVPRVDDYAANLVTPLKPYEAMALRRPLVVTRLPALMEVVGAQEERGLIAAPGSVESISAKIRLYVDDVNLRNEKAQLGYDWVLKERLWSNNAKRYNEIYEEVIELYKRNERVSRNASHN